MTCPHDGQWEVVARCAACGEERPLFEAGPEPSGLDEWDHLALLGEPDDPSPLGEAALLLEIVSRAAATGLIVGMHEGWHHRIRCWLDHYWNSRHE